MQEIPKGKRKKTVPIRRSKKTISLKSKKSVKVKRHPFRIFLRLIGLLCIWGFTITILMLAYETTQLPDISKLGFQQRSSGVRLIASDGVEFASFGDLYRKPILLKEIPITIINALLATEDRRFF